MSNKNSQNKTLIRINLSEANSKYLEELLQCMDPDYIESAIQTISKYTKAKYKNDKTELLLFFTNDTSNLLHYIDTPLLEIIPFNTQPKLYKHYDNNINYCQIYDTTINKITKEQIQTIKKYIKSLKKQNKVCKEESEPITITNKSYKPRRIYDGWFVDDKK